MFVCVVCKKTLSILDNEICNDCHKYIQNIKQKNVEKHCTLCKKEAPSMKEKIICKECDELLISSLASSREIVSWLSSF